MRSLEKTVGVARREKKLVTSLVSALQDNQKRGNRLVVASEFDCFQGVADVVTGLANGYRLFPSLSRQEFKPVSFSTAKVLSAVAGRKSTKMGRLVRVTGLSKATVRKELKLLQELRILKMTKKGQVSVRHEVRPPFKEITAYEVKVKDWKSGIYQARNYKSFAHKVNVALPLNRAKLLKKRLEIFRRMRVGLLGISASGDLKWFLHPRRQKPISGARNFLAAISLLKRGKPSVDSRSNRA